MKKMLTSASLILVKMSLLLGLMSTALAATPSSTDIIIPAPAQTISWEGYGMLKRICAAESNRANPNNKPRQFENDGVTPLWGRIKDPVTGKTVILKRDVGACQINTVVWKKAAEDMGYDIINSQDDNIEFAKWLYDQYGNTPWSASRDAWSHA